MHQFVVTEAPSAKRARIALFREVVGGSVSETVAMDCINSANGSIDAAVNLYFNRLGSLSTPITLDEDPPPPKPRFSECLCIGSINCQGSLTTKVSAAANELYMNTQLNCSFSIRPPTSPFPNTPPELVDLIHGSGFIRFSLPKSRSEIGRIPAPLAAVLCPLVKLGFAEVSLSVGFPGCAGMNMNPGASVPVRVDVAVTPEGMQRARSTVADDMLIERVSACWTAVLEAMNIAVSHGRVEESTSTSKPGELPFTALTATESAPLVEAHSEDGEEVMTEEMTKLVEVFSQPDLPQLRPPKSVFPTDLKFYQAQALFWMASREYPRAMDGLPASITSQADLQGANDAVDLEDSVLPPSWTEIPCGQDTLYFHDGFFQTTRPPPFVECRGGILADEMGLGKTVMTLSLISLDLLAFSSGPATSSLSTLFAKPTTHASLISGGTLVIVHLSLLKQWVSELRRHCPSLTHEEFHGSDRTSDVKKLASVDVVFSTYGTVAVNAEKTTAPLMQIAWRRVVLDEAHTIRTRSTKMAKAVARLTAERRWCLTGTPLQNSIEDIYPLVAWLRVTPWRSYAHFRKEVVAKLEIVGPGMTVSEGLLNAQQMLKPLMLRRTKATRGADGSPLVKLPPRRSKVVHVDMSSEEKDFYRALFWQTKLEFDKFEKSNAVMYNITHVLQLTVRLRQALCHPILCRTALINPDLVEVQGVDSLDALLQKFLEKDATSKEYLEHAIEDIKRIGVENIECPICLTEPCQFPVITPCGHTLCRKCAVSRLRGECPLCRAVFNNGELHGINHLAEQPPAVTGDAASVCPPLSSKLRVLLDYLARDLKKGRRVIVFSQFVSFIEIMSKVFTYKGIPHRTLHGGHTTNQREASTDWLSNADLSKDEKGWIDQLSEGMVEVSDNEDENDTPESDRLQGRVLLVSLKAGGVGLNLVAANVVYLTDLWWNPATEEQAFQRVHRLGQTKKTLTYKFVCRDTIDERILDLQATKSDMTSDVLGDNQVGNGMARAGGDRSRKLSLEDIRQLFKPQASSI